jgi:hypothetical protein
MELNVHKEVAAMQRLGAKQLRVRYAEAFGEETHANNKAWLVKRIAWRLQARAEGDLSERARRRAAELADDADLRLSPPRLPPTDSGATERTTTGTLSRVGDHRLPPPGAILTRPYKGEALQVKVLPIGFAFEGEVYKSLSSVAKAITGQHCNGYQFFRLGKEATR